MRACIVNRAAVRQRAGARAGQSDPTGQNDWSNDPTGQNDWSNDPTGQNDWSYATDKDGLVKTGRSKPRNAPLDTPVKTKRVKWSNAAFKWSKCDETAGRRAGP